MAIFSVHLNSGGGFNDINVAAVPTPAVAIVVVSEDLIGGSKFEQSLPEGHRLFSAST
ncbi:hypothetical protein DM860_001108 [Cuscuta australis]|uniref:Uncharacterized protein n=1 Tax=Cuscuta australis TaxID=267555 RepID=A0A328DWD1_9ASTE|nr:hypothetical protein DM860_001108 [Cuscuta australis]